MVMSAFQGTFSLLRSQQIRNTFLHLLDTGVIHESVLGQATAGPAMMLSLFNDLQNPLFHRTKFDPVEFLEGVGPALARFHNVSGSLENQLRTIANNAAAADHDDDPAGRGGGGGGGGDNEAASDTASVADTNTSRDSIIDNHDKPSTTEAAAVEAMAEMNGGNNVTQEEKDSMLAAFRATHSDETFITAIASTVAASVVDGLS